MSTQHAKAVAFYRIAAMLENSDEGNLEVWGIMQEVAQEMRDRAKVHDEAAYIAMLDGTEFPHDLPNTRVMPAPLAIERTTNTKPASTKRTRTKVGAR